MKNSTTATGGKEIKLIESGDDKYCCPISLTIQEWKSIYNLLQEQPKEMVGYMNIINKIDQIF